MSPLTEQERNLALLRRVFYAVVMILAITGGVLYFGYETPPGEMDVQRADSTGYELPPMQGVLLHNVPWTGGRAPYQPVASPAVVYKTNCAMCHGEGGRGDGPVGDSYIPKPPDLTTSAVRAESDKVLLAKVTDGILSAPVAEAKRYIPREWHAYRTLMTEPERRAVVAYIRQLGGRNAPAR